MSTIFMVNRCQTNGAAVCIFLKANCLILETNTDPFLHKELNIKHNMFVCLYAAVLLINVMVFRCFCDVFLNWKKMRINRMDKYLTIIKIFN